jgi:undecaprenyl-diphosphatase
MWPLRIAAVVVGSIAAVYGLGLIELPKLETFLLDVGDALGTWTYAVVGLLAFLETGAFVGLVAPGETAVIAGGVIAGQGKIDVVVLLLLVWACAVAGDSASFFIGKKLGRNFLVKHGPRVQITAERLAYVERFFARRGGSTILIGRFIGIVRAVAPFIAGASKMPYRVFLPYDVVGAGLWSAAFVLLGYFSWRNIDRAAEIASRGSLGVGTLAALGVGAYLGWRSMRTPEQRSALGRWVRRRRVGPTRENVPDR